MSFSIARDIPFLHDAKRGCLFPGDVEPEIPPGTLLAQSGECEMEANCPDNTLMARVCGSDPEALTILFRRYARTVRGVAYRVLRDPSEADDLLQDVFVLIQHLCVSFDERKGSARAWILQIAYRRAISRRRYLTARQFYSRVDLDEIDEQAAARGDKADESSIARIDAQAAWQQVLGELSDNQRETLRLYFFEGHTFPEIAEQLGQSVGNVSHHYYRGLERMRQRIFNGKLQGK